MKKLVNHASQDSIKAIKGAILLFKAFSPHMDLTQISYSDIDTPSRKSEYVLARQLLMYFLKSYTLASLNWIGAEVGKDHATVIHSVKVINNRYETDRSFRDQFDRLDATVKPILKKQKSDEEIPDKITNLQDHIEMLWNMWAWLKIA